MELNPFGDMAKHKLTNFTDWKTEYFDLHLKKFNLDPTIKEKSCKILLKEFRENLLYFKYPHLEYIN